MQEVNKSHLIFFKRSLTSQILGNVYCVYIYYVCAGVHTPFFITKL